jgi:hypothetical protein
VLVQWLFRAINGKLLLLLWFGAVSRIPICRTGFEFVIENVAITIQWRNTKESTSDRIESGFRRIHSDLKSLQIF